MSLKLMILKNRLVLSHILYVTYWEKLMSRNCFDHFKYIFQTQTFSSTSVIYLFQILTPLHYICLFILYLSLQRFNDSTHVYIHDKTFMMVMNWSIVMMNWCMSMMNPAQCFDVLVMLSTCWDDLVMAPSVRKIKFSC